VRRVVCVCERARVRAAAVRGPKERPDAVGGFAHVAVAVRRRGQLGREVGAAQEAQHGAAVAEEAQGDGKLLAPHEPCVGERRGSRE
jgi:hypothetical protein